MFMGLERPKNVYRLRWEHIREFKQIATAGVGTAAGSKFPQNVTLHIYVCYVHP